MIPGQAGDGEVARKAEKSQVEQRRRSHQNDEAEDVDNLDDGLEPEPLPHRRRDRVVSSQMSQLGPRPDGSSKLHRLASMVMFSARISSASVDADSPPPSRLSDNERLTREASVFHARGRG